MVQPISALPSSSASGLSRLPSRLRGAAASIWSRIAFIATEIGAVICEVRASALSCGSALRAGRLSSISSSGENASIAHSVPPKNAATITKPMRILRIGSVRKVSIRIGLYHTRSARPAGSARRLRSTVYFSSYVKFSLSPVSTWMNMRLLRLGGQTSRVILKLRLSTQTERSPVQRRFDPLAFASA